MGQKVAEQGSYSKFVTQFHGVKTQIMDTNVRLKPCTLICFELLSLKCYCIVL